MSNQTLVVLLFWSYFLCGLAFRIPDGANVCVKENDDGTTENYCCFNSYYDKGHCKVCSPGSFSTDGKECITCPLKMYGEQCKHRCSCNLNQTCNTVHGCVNLFVEKSSEGFGLYSNLKNEIISKWTAVALYETTAAGPATHGTSIDRDTSLVYYLVISGGVVGWMVFCVAGTKFLYKWFKRKHPRTQAPNDIMIPQIIVQSTSDPPKENIYDEIEEISTPEMTIKRAASYLSVIGSVKSLGLMEDQSQCQVHTVDSKPLNGDTPSVLSSSAGSSSDRNTLNDGNEYLHPYTSLKNDHDHKTYEQCTK